VIDPEAEALGFKIIAWKEPDVRDPDSQFIEKIVPQLAEYSFVLFVKDELLQILHRKQDLQDYGPESHEQLLRCILWRKPGTGAFGENLRCDFAVGQ
jgi:hypothetical protein